MKKTQSLSSTQNATVKDTRDGFAKVADNRNLGYFSINNLFDDENFDVYTKAVYMHIVRVAHNNYRGFFESHKTTSTKLRISETKLRECLSLLEHCNIIKILRRKDKINNKRNIVSLITLNDQSIWKLSHRFRCSKEFSDWKLAKNKKTQNQGSDQGSDQKITQNQSKVILQNSKQIEKVPRQANQGTSPGEPGVPRQAMRNKKQIIKITKFKNAVGKKIAKPAAAGKEYKNKEHLEQKVTKTALKKDKSLENQKLIKKESSSQRSQPKPQQRSQAPTTAKRPVYGDRRRDKDISIDQHKEMLLNKAIDLHRLGVERRECKPYNFDAFPALLKPFYEKNDPKLIEEFYSHAEACNAFLDVRYTQKKFQVWLTEFRGQEI